MGFAQSYFSTTLMSPIRVIADDREARCAVVEALSNIRDVQITIQRLELGDYELDGRILFERKTLIDLATSIKDGRLFRQASRLAASPLCKALLLEGTSRDLLASGMRREAIQGALVSVTLFFGIPLLRSMDAEETAHLMVYAARQFQSITKNALPHLFRGKRPKGKFRTQLQILQALPGIGPESARRLLDIFGSVEAVFSASLDDLKNVPGVGNTRARTVRWAVSETLSLYLPSEDPVL